MNAREAVRGTYENAAYVTLNVFVGMAFAALTLFVGGFVSGFFGLEAAYSYVIAAVLYFPLTSYVFGDYARTFYVIGVKCGD